MSQQCAMATRARTGSQWANIPHVSLGHLQWKHPSSLPWQCFWGLRTGAGRMWHHLTLQDAAWPTFQCFTSSLWKTWKKPSDACKPVKCSLCLWWHKYFPSNAGVFSLHCPSWKSKGANMILRFANRPPSPTRCSAGFSTTSHSFSSKKTKSQPLS